MSEYTALKKSKPLGALKCLGGYKAGGTLTTIIDSNRSTEAVEVPFVVEGTFEGPKETTMKSGDTKLGYHIRQQDNTLFIIDACATLNDEESGLAAVESGTDVKVEFIGTGKTKKGKPFAKFNVYVK
jgi:hypothetical protein